MLSDDSHRDTEIVDKWIGAAQSGDKDAYGKIYLLFHKRLYLYCLRMTSDSNRAEDIVQESFIKAWIGLKGFRFAANFYTWLRTIASRIIIDKLRLKESKVWLNAVDIEEANFVQKYDLDGRIDLEKLISCLPDGARTILIMHDIEGYGHREIAELTGIAEGTSKAQLSRARKLLKKELNQSEAIKLECEND